jgi:hypothetical protein
MCQQTWSCQEVWPQPLPSVLPRVLGWYWIQEGKLSSKVVLFSLANSFLNNAARLRTLCSENVLMQLPQHLRLNTYSWCLTHFLCCFFSFSSWKDITLVYHKSLFDRNWVITFILKISIELVSVLFLAILSSHWSWMKARIILVE